MNLIRTILFLLLVVSISATTSYSQGSDQKEEILSARQAAKDAKKNREYCDKLGFPTSAGDNRCFSIYPSEVSTWGKGFSGGLAKVSIKGRVGFINISGQLVIPAKLRDAGAFSEGLAPFENSSGKWGYIDKNGKIAISAIFDWAIPFREGLALVQVGKLWGYIDRSGTYVVQPKFEEAESFSEGFAAIGYYDKDLEWMAAYPRKGRWVRRFIDRSGRWAVAGDYDGISRGFDKGMAIVSRNLGYSEKYKSMISETYVMDTSGRELWKLDSASVHWFSDDAIIVEVQRTEKVYDSLYNFKDRAGKLLCNRGFENPGDFSEGLAPVRVDNKYGFINKQCNFVIQPQYSGAAGFSEGLAAVENGSSLTGFIDKSGNWVIEPKFRWVSGFHEGFALILSGSKSGYIDRTGKVIWPPSE